MGRFDCILMWKIVGSILLVRVKLDCKIEISSLSYKHSSLMSMKELYHGHHCYAYVSFVVIKLPSFQPPLIAYHRIFNMSNTTETKSRYT